MIAKKNLTLLIFSFSLIIFFLSYSLSADFGKYKPDYFEAHLLGMKHLHTQGNLFDLIKTIPNSASGVLPLYIYGFFDSQFFHKLLSLISLFSIFVLIWINDSSRKHEYSFLFISAMLISPSVISSTVWCLPEIFTLLVFFLACNFFSNKFYLSLLFSFALPFCRQTFIVLIALKSIFFIKQLSILKKIFLELLFASCALLILYIIWGGLVPPSKASVHLTPSYKSFYISILIFSSYFLYDNIRRFNLLRFISINWLIFYAAFSFLLTYYNFLQKPLLGGGFIFSRIEEMKLSFMFDYTFLLFFLLQSSWRVKIFVFLASLTFSTTNYLFMKYTDFFVFAFLFLYYLKPAYSKERFYEYVKSIFIFEGFYLLLSYIYYYLI
jgi:hypothetical protein